MPLKDALRRIEVALAARRSQDVLIVARTDARTSLGLDEAIVRARAFAKAGADIVFVEAPESDVEFERIGQALAGDAWLLANMVPSGKSPLLTSANLKRYGFSIVIYPTAGMNAACAAMEQTFLHLQQHGSTAGSSVPAYSMDQLHTLVGFADVWEFEKRYPASD